MRVTSTIKGYIISTVKDIYQTKIDSVKVEYDKRRADCISEIESYLVNVNSEVCNILSKFDMDKDSNVLTFGDYRVRNEEEHDKYVDKLHELRRERDKIADSIIINLELGKLKLNQLEDELKKIK